MNEGRPGGRSWVMWVEVSGLAGRLALGWFWWREGMIEEA